jgi:alpha-glucosidase
MTRLQETYDTLNQTWPLGWSPDELIDAMQSGDRLTYHPEAAGSELAHYWKVLPQATANVQALTKGLTREQMEIVAKRVGVDWKSDAANRKISEYDKRVARAAAEISDIGPHSQ